MTPPKKRKLQLVPYEPDNYTPGEVLALDDATVVKSDKAIGSALSLYFQWEKKRSCHITFSEGPAQLCEMDYDHDEASPTEIRIQLLKISKKKSFKVVPGATVLIRFEIFRVTYVFTSTVTAVSTDPKVEGWHSIIEVPQELRVLKSRHLPRLELDDAGRAKLPRASWISKSGNVLDLKLLEIGMGSVHASLSDLSADWKEKTGKLSLGKASVPVEVVRAVKNEIIFKLRFAGHEDFGLFWDYYRLVAYPSMRSRYEVPFEKGVELYKKTNYFGAFHGEKTQLEIKELTDTWESIRSGFHETIVDYYITNSANEPSGCGGLALLLYSDERPIWMLHQLCAIKQPDLIVQSGVLHIWRAEYLAARAEALDAVVSFRSASRWMERIYVKHTRNSRHGSRLFPTKNKNCEFGIRNDPVEIPVMAYSIGKLRRVCTKAQEVWAAANPKYLNANGALDLVIAVFETVPWLEIERIVGRIASSLKLKHLSMLVTLPHDYDMDLVRGTDQISDRFAQIPKDDLFTFISSVEHSIAITERKLIDGTHQ
jgi:hypothetical protein